jgi:hypothetical protein
MPVKKARKGSVPDRLVMSEEGKVVSPVACTID